MLGRIGMADLEITPVAQHRPGDAGQFIGERDGKFIGVQPSGCRAPRRTFTLDFFPGSRASVSSTLTLIESRVIPLKIIVFVPIF
jgi:hypothetical protein